MLRSFCAIFGGSLQKKHLSGVELFDFQQFPEYKYDKKKHCLDGGLYNCLLLLVNLSSRQKFIASFHRSPSYSTPILLDHVQRVRSTSDSLIWYSKFNGKTGSCFIIYEDPSAARPSSSSSQMIGQVEDVLLHRRICNEETITEPFLIVRNYKLVESNKTKDSYQTGASHLSVFLCYIELEEVEHPIRLQDIHSHFAA